MFLHSSESEEAKKAASEPEAERLRLTSEELEQAAFLHELSDDVVRGGGRAHGEQSDEVTVAQTLQDLNFPVKLSVVQLRV